MTEGCGILAGDIAGIVSKTMEGDGMPPNEGPSKNMYREERRAQSPGKPQR